MLIVHSHWDTWSKRGPFRGTCCAHHTAKTIMVIQFLLRNLLFMIEHENRVIKRVSSFYETVYRVYQLIFLLVGYEWTTFPWAMLIVLNKVNDISSSSTTCSVGYVPLCIPFERKYMQIKNFVREALHIPWRKFMQTFTSCCQINIRKYCVWYWILEKINLSYIQIRRSVHIQL